VSPPNSWSQYVGEPEQTPQTGAPPPPQVGVPPGYPYGPPGYPMPPPPKKSGAVTAIAALLGGVALAVGGYFAYDHFVAKKDGDSTASNARSTPAETDGPASKAGAIKPTASPAKPTLGEGFSAHEQEYVDRLGDSGVVVHTPALAVHDGHDACKAILESGSVLDAITLMQKYNAEMGEIGAIVTTVVAVQTLCPQNSHLGTSTTTGNPLPPGDDGEFISRLQDVGMSVDNQADAIGDAHKVCTIMENAPSDKFLTAVQVVADLNPRASRTAAAFMTVIAIQVYCPPR